MNYREKAIIVTVATPIVAVALILLIVLSKFILCSALPAPEIRTMSKIVRCAERDCECEVNFSTSPRSLKPGERFRAKHPKGVLLLTDSLVFTTGDQIDP